MKTMRTRFAHWLLLHPAVRVATFLLLVLISTATWAGTIKAWTTGDTLSASDLNANFQHIHNLMVGGHGPRLVDADVNASAAISTTKLAGKVNLAKAWGTMTAACTVNGACTVGVSNGIGSIVRTGAGIYTVSWTSARPNALYTVLVSQQLQAALNFCSVDWPTISTASAQIDCFNTGFAAADAKVSVVMFDDND